MKTKIIVTVFVLVMMVGLFCYIQAKEKKSDLNQLLIQPDRPVSFGEQIGGGFVGNPYEVPPEVKEIMEADMPPEIKKQIEEENKKMEDSRKRYEKINKLSGVFDCSYEFSKKFFAQSDKKENFVISPISVYILLSLISQGAEGNTKKEIENLTAMNVENIEVVAKGIYIPEE